MATQQGWFGYSLLDELGEGAAAQYHVLVDDTVALGTILASVGGTAALLDLVTAAQIVKMRLVIDLPPAGLKPAPLPGARVEQTGLFNLHNTMSPGRFASPVYGLGDTKILSGKINLADADIANWITGLTNPFGGGQFATPNYQPIPIGGLADVILAFRRRRHMLSRTSLELP